MLTIKGSSQPSIPHLLGEMWLGVSLPTIAASTFSWGLGATFESLCFGQYWGLDLRVRHGEQAPYCCAPAISFESFSYHLPPSKCFQVSIYNSKSSWIILYLTKSHIAYVWSMLHYGLRPLSRYLLLSMLGSWTTVLKFVNPLWWALEIELAPQKLFHLFWFPISCEAPNPTC